MVLAISLIKVVPDQEKMVYHALKEVVGVKNLYHIFGEHDFFLMLEAENANDLARILDNIKEMSYVGSVKSMLVAPTGRYGMDRSSMRALNFLQPGVCCRCSP